MQRFTRAFGASNGSSSQGRTKEHRQKEDTTGVFLLPTRLERVKKDIHQNSPDTLPGPEASVHEVRYFLYRLLTVEQYRIAKQWPQWVIETCNLWEGNGAAFRALSDNSLTYLCPLDKQATYDNKQKISQTPPPDCRGAIGKVIAREVKKLRALEESTSKLQREWKNIQLGGSAKNRIITGRSRGPRSVDNLSLATHIERITPARSYSAAHLPPFTNQMIGPEIYPSQPCQPWNAMAMRSEPQIFHPNMASSLYPEMPTSMYGTAGYQYSTGSQTNSTHDSPRSANSDSTAMTSPLYSYEEMARQNATMTTDQHFLRQTAPGILYGNTPPPESQSRHNIMTKQPSNVELRGDYFSRGVPTRPGSIKNVPTPPPSIQNPYKTAPLTRENLYRGIPQPIQSPPPRLASRTPSRISESARSQQSFYSSSNGGNPYTYTRFQERLANGSTSMIAPSRQQSCASSQSTGTYRRAASLRTQDMHIPGSYPASSDILTREAEDKLTRLPSISTALYRSTPLSPNLPRRETASRSSTSFSNGQQYRANVHPRSMSYPRQSIFSPRSPAAFRSATSASSSAAPSSRQKPPKPAFEKFPVNQKPKVPVLPNFTPPSRSSATQSVDRFALEQGAYTTFKGRINDSNRTQVVNNEIERMHGMVPSNLFDHGLDPIGPSMRIHSPDGKPYSTLVEQIAHREILDGKKQKGSDRWHG